MKKGTVLAFGTFDGFHEGHRHFLEEAKTHGTRLVVVVARDKTVERLKGHLPTRSEEERQRDVEQAGIADEAVLGSLFDPYWALNEYRPDVIVLGYDQKSILTENLKKELQRRDLPTRIVRAGAFQPDVYKSSILKEKGGM
jgi:FAD synthetase